MTMKAHTYFIIIGCPPNHSLPLPPSSGGATVYGRRQIIVLYSPGGTDVFVYLSTVFCAYRNLPLRLQIVRFCSF